MSRLFSMIRKLVKPRSDEAEQQLVPLATVWQMPDK